MNSRKVFIDTLSELARKDPTIMLIVGDVGFSYIEDFAQEFPDQFINAGVTEQSMMGMAAGMALSGLKPYVYSMIPFVLFRNYEQVRNDVVQHKANVKIIGVKGSEHYKFLGFSHNLVTPFEDFVVCDNIGLKWAHPGTELALTDALKFLYSEPTPYYIRL